MPSSEIHDIWRIVDISRTWHTWRASTSHIPADTDMSLTKLRFTNQVFPEGTLRILVAARNGTMGAAQYRSLGPAGQSGCRGRLPGLRTYDSWRDMLAASSNSPFLAPSRKHAHSFRSNTRTRPARSPATRISTQSPLAHRRLSGKAISIEPSSSPDRSQVSAAGSMPRSSGIGLMTSSLVSYGFFATAQYSQREPSLSASSTSSAPHRPL
jgi:hypothetical protein